MRTHFYPSAFHEAIHKIACGVALAMALCIGIPAVNIAANRIASAKSLHAWCAGVGCISQPGAFSADPLIVYSDKGREAAQLIERLYRPSPFPYLDQSPPQVQTVNRVANNPAINKKGSKK